MKKYKCIKMQRISEWYRAVLNNISDIGAKETNILGYDQKTHRTISGCHRPVWGFRWQPSWSPLRLISHRTAEKESKVVDCKRVNHQTCSTIQNTLSIPFSDKASDAFNKTVREIVRIAYFTKSVDHISIEFRMSDPLLQKSLQTGVVLTNKVTITFIKLHKERTKFMITVTLLEKFTCNYSIAIIKIFDIVTSSSKADEL